MFVYLVSEDTGNHFTSDHFKLFSASYPEIELTFLNNESALLDALPSVEWLDTWYFKREWFALAPRLQAVFTPAAGKDWVYEDPQHLIPTYYGKFHGTMIAESMLGLMLHFNRNMSEMLALQHKKIWDRNALQGSTLLRNQSALIVGYGNIGRRCGQLLTGVGMSVSGYQRRHPGGFDPETGVKYIDDENLETSLGLADHIIDLLPGGDQTRYFMSRDLLAKIKPGAFFTISGAAQRFRNRIYSGLWTQESSLARVSMSPK